MRDARPILCTALSLVLSTACLPPLHDPAGYACDEQHQCPDQLRCIANQCRGDAGTTIPRWSQVRDGFDGTLISTTCAGCGVSVGSQAGGNVVTASMSPDGTRYVAFAQDAGVIVAVPRGRVRGELRVPGVFPNDNSGFFTVESADSNFVLNLYLKNTQVGVYSAPGALSDGQESVFGDVAIDGGAWHVVEARWVRGSWRKLWVDGTLAASTSASPVTDAGPGLLPASVRAGINNYNGTTGPLWTVELRNWVYSDDPDAVFP